MLRLSRIREASSQRHNLCLPGAVNQLACICTPSYRDSDLPGLSQCPALALASNESAKQCPLLMPSIMLSGRPNDPSVRKAVPLNDLTVYSND